MVDGRVGFTKLTDALKIMGSGQVFRKLEEVLAPLNWDKVLERRVSRCLELHITRQPRFNLNQPSHPNQPTDNRPTKGQYTRKADTMAGGDYENFEGIHMDLSRQPGRCRFNASGMGWRPVDGEMRMLVNSEIASAQWSRAAKGYEVKIITRTMGIVQLDGFEQDVCFPLPRRPGVINCRADC